MVGGGDNAFLFHFVNQRSRTIVADAKLALNIACLLYTSDAADD